MPLRDSPLYWVQKRETALRTLLEAEYELNGAEAQAALEKELSHALQVAYSRSASTAPLSRTSDVAIPLPASA